MILAVDASSVTAAAALCSGDGAVVRSDFLHNGLTHSETLLPMIRRVLGDTSVADLDAIAVTAGPGSFTGVRIGVAAAKGLAFARNTLCVGVSTLAAMARLAEGLPFDGIVCAAMDARCRQVYTALFACENGRVSRLTPDEALSLDDLEKHLLSTKKSIFLVGDGAELCYNTFGNHMPGVVLAPPHLRYQQAVGVAAEAAAGPEQAVSAERLQPVYLRLPQAERELRARQGLAQA